MAIVRVALVFALLLTGRWAHAEPAGSVNPAPAASATSALQPYEPPTTFPESGQEAALPHRALTKPMAETVDWTAPEWISVMLMGDVGGAVLGVGGGIVGAALGVAICDRSAEGSFDCLENLGLGLLVGGLVGWSVGVPGGVTLTAKRTGLRDGKYGAAFAGSLLGTLASGLLLAALYEAGADDSVMKMGAYSLLVLPTLGAAMGYNRSASHGVPAPALSLIHYDDRSGFRMGAPAVSISQRNGERRTMVSLLGGKF